MMTFIRSIVAAVLGLLAAGIVVGVARALASLSLTELIVLWAVSSFSVLNWLRRGDRRERMLHDAYQTGFWDGRLAEAEARDRGRR